MFRSLLGGAALVSAITIGFATAASAEQFGNFSVTGHTQLDGYFSSTSSSDFYLFGTFDLTYGFSGPDAPVGLELSATALGNADTRLGAVFGGVYFDALGGRVVVGVPKSAFEVLQPSVGQEYFGLFQIELGVFRSSLTTFAQYADGVYSPGLRYDRTFGDTDVSLSYNNTRISSTSLHVLGASARRDFGQITAAAGAEYAFDGSGDHATSFFAGIEGETGPGHYGLTYNYSDSLYKGSILTGFYDHQIRPNLSVGVLAMSFFDSGPGTLYGAQAHYTFAQNGYVHGAVFGATNSSGWGATLGVGLEY